MCIVDYMDYIGHVYSIVDYMDYIGHVYSIVS